MRTYVANIIPKIQKYSQKLDNLTKLTNQHWVVLNELEQSKTVYIFRVNGELLISINGKVDKAKWEYLGADSILIDLKDQSYLFRNGFLDENILALKIDSKEEYAILVNESKYQGELNSISAVINFLSDNYLENPLLENNNLRQLNLGLNSIITYRKSSYNLKIGNFTEFLLTFNNGRKFNIYQKKSNGKYFIYLKDEITVFPDRETCVKHIESWIK